MRMNMPTKAHDDDGSAEACATLSAILAGMIWYKPFFGDHDAMTGFFAMPTTKSR